MHRAIFLVLILLVAAANGLHAETRVVILQDRDSKILDRVMSELQLRMLDSPDVVLVREKTSAPLRNVAPSTLIKDQLPQLKAIGASLEAEFVAQLRFSAESPEPSAYLLIDVSNGDLIDSATFARPHPQTIAASISTAIANGVASKAGDTLIRVSIAGVIADDLPLGQRNVVGAFREAITHRLANAAAVAVTEDIDPARLIAAARLDRPEPSMDVIASIRVIRDGSQFVANASLRDGRLSPIGTAKGTSHKIDATFVERLTSAICDALEVSPPETEWDINRLAKVMQRQMELASSRRDLVGGIRAGEMAILLDPTNATVMRRLGDLLTSDSILRQALSADARALGLPVSNDPNRQFTSEEARLFLARGIAMYGQVIAAEPTLSDPAYFFGNADNSQFNFHVRNLLRQVRDVKMENDELEKLRRPIRDGYLALFRKLNDAVGNDPNMLPAYSSELSKHLSDVVSLVPDDAPGIIADWFAVHCELNDPDAWASSMFGTLQNMGAFHGFRGPIGEAIVETLEGNTDPFASLLRDYLEKEVTWKRAIPAMSTRVEFLAPWRTRVFEYIDEALEQDKRSAAVAAAKLICFAYRDSRRTHSPARANLDSYRDELLFVARALIDRKLGTSLFVTAVTPLATDETAKTIWRLIEDHRIAAKRTPEIFFERNVNGDLQAFNVALASLRQRYPSVDGRDPNRFFTLTQLFDAGKYNDTDPFLLHPKVQDSTVHALFFRASEGRRSTVVQLVSMPLDGGDPEFGGTSFKVSKGGGFYSLQQSSLTASAVDGSGLYAAGEDIGIVRFDFEQPTVETLPAAINLPDSAIRTMAIVDGVIYAGTSDGNFLRLRVDDSDVEFIASASRQTATTPLDARTSYSYDHIIHDAARNRLFLVIGGRSTNRITELWSFDLKTEEFAKLFEIPSRGNAADAWLVGDKLVLVNDWIVEWDATTDKGLLTASQPTGTFNSVRNSSTLRSVRQIAFCKGRVWWLDRDRILRSHETQSGVRRMHLLNLGQRRENVPRDSGTHYLVSVSPTRFLMYREGRLWSVEPKDVPVSEDKEAETESKPN